MSTWFFMSSSWKREGQNLPSAALLLRADAPALVRVLICWAQDERPPRHREGGRGGREAQAPGGVLRGRAEAPRGPGCRVPGAAAPPRAWRPRCCAVPWSKTDEAPCPLPAAQEAASSHLAERAGRGLRWTKEAAPAARSLVVAGGVAANQVARRRRCAAMPVDP